jgi:hypothetical protein
VKLCQRRTHIAQRHRTEVERAISALFSALFSDGSSGDRGRRRGGGGSGDETTGSGRFHSHRLRRCQAGGGGVGGVGGRAT